jgi:RNA polymerase sigma-70 factor (ECF subfamily)
MLLLEGSQQNFGDSSPTSLSLLSGLRIQQPEAWQRLARLYGPLVYSWCRRQGLQPADVDDIVQEVFRTLLARIAEFRRDQPGSSFRGWLYTITRNKLGDFWRRRSAQPQAIGGSAARERLEEVAIEETPENSTSGQLASLYRRALDLICKEFEARTWQAFWLVVCENRVPADVAAQLDLSLNAVYLAKSRILRRLRETLGEVPEEQSAEQSRFPGERGS